MAIIHIFPFGIIFEPVSDSILNPLGLGVGTGDQTFGVRVLTSIYSAAVFFLLLDLLWALPKAISYHLAENTSDSRTYHYMSVIWGILTSTVIVPLIIVIITTFVASQVSTGEDLWEIMKAGYAGAIIGVYRQFVLAVRKRV
ncbi:hypothetical protein [Halorubrum sp. 2020YC2]|uniref:hypothetical protein n=1 Tax=Halorubrum sp. 2020YC2 TaxID=2836432 RepID=UPI001BE7C0D9|nr:hypothetical protein [Halorubrum sp. 2020YC2]QWC18144.1 hypothetical protein KI388_08135 [Halorubrum sp. 2020YC2]